MMALFRPSSMSGPEVLRAFRWQHPKHQTPSLYYYPQISISESMQNKYRKVRRGTADALSALPDALTETAQICSLEGDGYF